MSPRTGRWGLRLLAVVGAIVVWWLASVEKRERISERLVDASVSYNPPQGLILLDPIQTVKVRLRGPDRRVRAVTPFDLGVVVDVTAQAPGTFPIQLSPSNVVAPQEVEVVAVEPNTLAVRIDREETLALRVVVRLVGEPAGGAVLGQPRSTPDRVQVRGPQSLLLGLASVATAPISLDGHALSFTQTVSVVSSDPLVQIVEPLFVSVEVPMQNPDTPETADPDDDPARRDDGR